jgi:hypothetical protein
MKPFFSILVPVYNHEKFVGMALDSLLLQTDTDWEACVIDDGSTDGTPDILDAYALRDPRIRVFRKPNGGEASALNAAWRETRGTWIGWLSSDDLFLPNKLAIHREWIIKNPDCRYFFTDFQTLDNATGLVKNGYTARTPEKGLELVELLATNYINGISMCVHREVFEAVGAFDEVTRHGQDYDFHLRAVASYAPIRIPEITCVQRTHIGQLSQQHTQAMLYDCAAAAIRFLNTVQPEALMGPLADFSLGEGSKRLDEAVTVAASPNSFLNLIGPHPALVMHLVSWLAGVVKTNSVGRPLIGMMGRKARAIAWTRKEMPDAGLWQALSVMCDMAELPTSSEPVQVEEVIDVSFFWAKARGEARGTSLAEYAANRQKRQIFGHAQVLGLPPLPVIWIPLFGRDIPEEADVLHMAERLMESGAIVVVLRQGQAAWTWRRGILTVTVSSPIRAMFSLAATPGAPVVLMHSGQKVRWWWSLVWRVVKCDPENLSNIGKTVEQGDPENHGVRLCSGVGRFIGRCLRFIPRGNRAVS